MAYDYTRFDTLSTSTGSGVTDNAQNSFDEYFQSTPNRIETGTIDGGSYPFVLQNKTYIDETQNHDYIITETSTPIDYGSYVVWDNSTWLIVNKEIRAIQTHNASRAHLCNIQLKWTDSNDNEVLYMATNKILSESSHGYIDSKNIDTIDGSMRVYVQKNSETETIYEGQRFIIGRNAYSVKLIEDIYPQNVLTIFFEVDSLNKDADDLTNDIADNSDATGWTF